MQAVLKAQINKTDRNDARGIAQMMRAGLYRPVHVKTLRSQKLRMLLTHRQSLQSKAIAVENDLRGTLRNFGLKVGMVGKVKFEARIRELVENQPDLAVLVEPMLIVRRVLREQIVILHRDPGSDHLRDLRHHGRRLLRQRNHISNGCPGSSGHAGQRRRGSPLGQGGASGVGKVQIPRGRRQLTMSKRCHDLGGLRAADSQQCCERMPKPVQAEALG